MTVQTSQQCGPPAHSRESKNSSPASPPARARPCTPPAHLPLPRGLTMACPQPPAQSTATEAAQLTAETEGAGELAFADLLATAEAWALAFYQHLDQRSRLAVACSSTECRHWVTDTAQQCTVSLLAYGGLPDTAWQARRAAVEQVLEARGLAEHRSNTSATSSSCGTNTGSASNSDHSKAARGTKLVLRVPTPNLAALQTALSLPPGAGRAVTEVQVLQRSGAVAIEPPAPALAWPQTLPPVFSNLVILTLKPFCTPLPHPALLPSLRDMRVHFRYRGLTAQPDAGVARAIAAMCASAAPYLPQLTALSVFHGWNDTLPWSTLLTTHTHTLTSVTSNTGQVPDMLQLLLQHAPRLERLSCDTEKIGTELADKQWAVREFAGRAYRSCDAADIAALPRSPDGLRLLPSDHCVIYLHCEIVGPQGLSDALRQRMQQWQLTAPCEFCVSFASGLPPGDLRAGTEAALRQLSMVLPAGSWVLVLVPEGDWQSAYAIVHAGVAAARPVTQHLTVYTSDVDVKDNLITAASQNDPPGTVWRLSCYELRLSGACASVPWPLQGLYVSSLRLIDLLRLPDPTGGQYEIHVELIGMSTTQWIEPANEWVQWTPDMVAQLEQRLQHLTFVVHDELIVCLDWFKDQAASSEQPAALRQQLQLLRRFRWRFEPSRPRVNVTLGEFWVLSPELLAELRGLPTIHPQAKLSLYRCAWPAEPRVYEPMASLVPTSYTRWEIVSDKHQCSAQQVEAVCMDAQARGAECERLCLEVRRSGGYSDVERSQVERCIDERGMGRWVDVEWDHWAT